MSPAPPGQVGGWEEVSGAARPAGHDGAQLRHPARDGALLPAGGGGRHLSGQPARGGTDAAHEARQQLHGEYATVCRAAGAFLVSIIIRGLI